MSTFHRLAGEFRFRYLAYLALIFLCLNVILRLALQFTFTATLPFSETMVPGLLKGALNDCAALAYALLLPATLILLPTDRFLQRRAGKIYAALVLFIFSTTCIFTAFAEYFFWDEFSARFNFIAVDYLIYTTELMQNMVESYPLAWLLLAVFVLAALVTFLLWGKLRHVLPKIKTQPSEYYPHNGSLSGRLGMLGSLYAAAALLFVAFTPLTMSQDRFWNEYAKNGSYEIFSAYLNNQLDYRAFYKTMDTRTAFALMQANITDVYKIFEASKGENLLRVVADDGQEKTPNVIVVIMESMGSKWFGEEYTPNLSALSKNGLSFTRMMSTGTRTVRGIEAVMLSVPPTPGNSIVRRPDSDRLFNLGTLFRLRNYDRDFLYGGIGYFDNMNAFFAGNGYTVADKLGFAPESKTFSNAWGQCDEDLYSESLRRADKSFRANRPFHQVLLTTSNHRPFTFPEGKINVEPGSRRAAIKYADYAIGRFMDEAREKPWFDNTVFVFVGDHPSSIAGKTEVPADAYGIVCIMYGPQFLKPEKVETLCSQIDIAPTLLASLGWKYRSPFFGTNARELPVEAGRAWISTYQLLGFRTEGHLVVLKPDASAEVSRLEQTDHKDMRQDDEAFIFRAVASYQCAYDLFTQKRLKESVVASYTPLLHRSNLSINSRGLWRGR